MIDLSPEQEAVASTLHGPVLVMASAGSGKTSTLAMRIARTLQMGIPAEEILAITFTNKAGRELGERVSLYAGRPIPWCGTFHGLAARLLRQIWDPTFIIVDETDGRAIFRAICRERSLLEDLVSGDSKRDETALCDRAHEEMSSARDRGLSREEMIERSRSGSHIELADRAWHLYLDRLTHLRALDFPGILEKLRDMCRRDAALCQRFRFVQVDEYQDTNALQDEIVGLLAGYYGNVCAVGDEKQSIYGWRGADIDNFRRFPERWPGCKQLSLSVNYRSRPAICATAERLMTQAGDLSYPASVRPARAGLGGVTPYVAASADDEAERVVRRIRWHADKDGRRLSDCAILYRAHLLSLPIERALINGGIPYQVVGGLGLLQRAAAKDLIAYLRLSVRPDDDLAFERALKAPSRGIGPAAIAAARAAAPDKSLLEAFTVALGRDAFKPSTRAAVLGFVSLISDLHGIAAEAGAAAVLEHVLQESGILGDKRPAEDLEAAREAGAELLRLGEGGISVELLLEQVALQSGEDAETGDRVTMSTLHGSKGREWPIVFAVGWDAATLPSPRSDLEEERRLAYVTITRARDQLYIGWPRTRRDGGCLEPSPFLAEAGCLVP